MQMGVRMYSARIGRFLSVDPLHELMPSHNPYHYAFNSPLVWKDPSGLAPEKDKNIHSEKLQGQFIKLRDLSTPIMPGDEYWVYVKDDRDRFIDFYFSAEYGGDSYIGALWHTNLSMFAMLGMGGSSSSGGGSEGGGPRTYDPNNLLHPNGNGVNDVVVSSGQGIHDDPNQVSIFMGILCSVKAPRNWSANNIDNQLEKGGFYNIISIIESKISTKEIGCFLIYDEITNKISGYFYLGYAYDRWFNFSKYASKAPDNFPILNSNQMVIGFIHNHLTSYNTDFSGGDGNAIRFFTKGSLKWTNVPQPSDKNDPKILDRMFFGLVHSKGRDGLSFDKMYYNYDIKDLYRNIIGNIFMGETRPPNFDHIGFDFFNDKGKKK